MRWKFCSFGNRAMMSSGAEVHFSAFLTWIIKLIKDKYRSVPVFQNTRQPGCRSRTSYSVTPVRLGGMSEEAHTVIPATPLACMETCEWFTDLSESASATWRAAAECSSSRNQDVWMDILGQRRQCSCEWSLNCRCFTSECNKTIKRKTWQLCHGEWGVLQVTKFPPIFFFVFFSTSFVEPVKFMLWIKD